MISKSKIQSRFNTASKSYEDVADVQKECAQILISNMQQIMPQFNPSSILDLGTGTGFVAELLLPIYPHATYTLNDIAPNMLSVVRDKFNQNQNVEFFLGDIDNTKFASHDLIISNLAFQWLDNLDYAIGRFTSEAKVFAFSCLLDGSFEEWNQILSDYGVLPVRTYPTLNDLSVKGAVREFKLTFANAHAFLKYLQSLGASASSAQVPQKIIKDLVKNHQQQFIITYKVFFGIIV